MITAELKLAQK